MAINLGVLKELRKIRDEIGPDVDVYFDTEAQTFKYHMAKIGSVYAEQHPRVHVALHEER